MSILKLENICKTFGTHKANDHISIEVPENKIFGLLGPNGAGKTTLIRIITNIIGADSGNIYFLDKPYRPQDQRLIGYLPEERGLYKKMKVGEHLIYLARLKDLSGKEAKEKIQYWMEKFEITSWWDKKVEELSKGMQQKVQFISTVVHEPRILILDEPFSGLDPVNTNLIKDEIFRLKRQGTSIIFSTHRMEQVEEICEEIVLINNGKNILGGTVPDIKQQFKEHQYSITYEGNLPETLSGALNIVVQSDHELIIQLNEGQTFNEPLKYLIDNKVQVNSCHEILPSLNQIFIQQVAEQHG